MNLVLLCFSIFLGFEYATTESLAAERLNISSAIFDNSALDPVVKIGSTKFENALAMNIQYGEVLKARRWIEKEIGSRLNFFKEWSSYGEAHITVITPPEYYDVLRNKVSMDEIGRIAHRFKIQSSSFEIKGIGTGKAMLDDRIESTYFFIVYSANLIRIREAIYRLFLSRGGDPMSWNPRHYYPHITIGFTRRDLHESDGVIKNVENSFDYRFPISVWGDYYL